MGEGGLSDKRRIMGLGEGETSCARCKSDRGSCKGERKVSDQQDTQQGTRHVRWCSLRIRMRVKKKCQQQQWEQPVQRKRATPFRKISAW
jgi:hypothetical protein